MNSFARPPPQTIYVADDDDAMREVVTDALAAEGHAVRQASDGQQLLDGLLEAVRSGHPVALAVSDVAMPRMTGTAACVAARLAGVDTPFIFMTAFASVDGRAAAEAVGAVAVFDKPFDIGELLAAVRRLFQG